LFDAREGHIEEHTTADDPMPGPVVDAKDTCRLIYLCRAPTVVEARAEANMAEPVPLRRILQVQPIEVVITSQRVTGQLRAARTLPRDMYARQVDTPVEADNATGKDLLCAGFHCLGIQQVDCAQLIVGPP
jgi:hypothetical protein